MAVAEKLLVSGDPDVRRAVVLESITALEAFVERTVFALLEGSIDPLLVRWLKDRTRMDFESRLSVITPVALGRPVDKASALWTDYTRAKQIRNRITHSGRKVTEDEARFVLQTVRSWLGYLGSTAEVAVALQGLKTWIEVEGIPVASARAATDLVVSYFANTSPAVHREVDTGTGKADLLLSYGPETVVVEVKILPRTSSALEPAIAQATSQVGQYARSLGATRAAVVVFVRDAPPEAFRAARLVDSATVSVIVIQAADG